jgi:NAD(P)-dependent dehydrogenase (short-subunit alcohol dehydrogenase family)
MGFYGGKRVFVTGGSSGIGLSACEQLARAGANVALAARDEKRLASALERVRKEKATDDARLVAVPMDVTSAVSVEQGVARALEELGGIDIVVNNAGYAIPGYIERLTEADFEAMLQVNYLGAVRVVRAFLPHLMKQRSGAIANVTSMLGFMGTFGYAAYAGSKYALSGFTECLRQDLLPFDVSVHLCYPPTTKTPGLDKENEIKPPEAWAIEGKSRAYTADDVAKALLDGIEKKRFYILAGSDSAFIWRMQRWAPWLVRRVTDGVLMKHLAKHGDGRKKLDSEAPPGLPAGDGG